MPVALGSQTPGIDKEHLNLRPAQEQRETGLASPGQESLSINHISLRPSP